MLTDLRAPLIFGCLMILLLGAFLAFYRPMPGGLAAPHARIEGLTKLQGCKSCHAEGGLAGGCLSCHEEIREQLAKGAGYHDFLLHGKEAECARCHPEHLGGSFDLVSDLAWKDRSKTAFNHAHLSYHLAGKHAGLACAECHEKKVKTPFSLSRFAAMPRGKTFLGLSQDCIACHDDIHSGGLSRDCESCHGQDGFRPASRFDHAKFFALDGGHQRLECAACHVIPAPTATGAQTNAARSLPFDKVKGKTCVECHASPHRAPLGKDCERCHPGSAPRWAQGASGMTADAHALTGFHLVPPHVSVECEKCHKEGLDFQAKFPDPLAIGYTRAEDSCQGCHVDVHEGQFRGKHDRCTDCHERHTFTPARFGPIEHSLVFGLKGAHAAVPCASCHKKESGTHARRFTGAPKECKACHADPHGEQFAAELSKGDCTTCHGAGAETFAIRPFDHAKRTRYALTGAHAKADCGACHFAAPPPSNIPAVVSAASRLYRGTPDACSSCHRDAHRGQFREGTLEKGRNDGVVRCERCHTSTLEWKELQFDHDLQSRFALDRTHVKVPCGGCHPTVKLADGIAFVQYKPIGTECEDCHAVKRR